MITANELLRMKHDAVLLSKEERANEERIRREQREKQTMAARQKREKMQA